MLPLTRSNTQWKTLSFIWYIGVLGCLSIFTDILTQIRVIRSHHVSDSLHLWVIHLECVHVHKAFPACPGANQSASTSLCHICQFKGRLHTEYVSWMNSSKRVMQQWCYILIFFNFMVQQEATAVHVNEYSQPCRPTVGAHKFSSMSAIMSMSAHTQLCLRGSSWRTPVMGSVVRFLAPTATCWGVLGQETEQQVSAPGGLGQVWSSSPVGVRMCANEQKQLA